MAELRVAEEKIHGLRVAYTELREQLRASGAGGEAWPALGAEEQASSDADPLSTTGSSSNNDDDANNSGNSIAAAAVLQTLESIREQLLHVDLQTKMEKFEKRLNERDPITDKPRYGEKTQQRVTELLRCYKELHRTLQHLYGEAPPEEEADEIVGNNTRQGPGDSAAETLEMLKKQAEQEQQRQLEAERREQEAQAAAAAAAERERQTRLEEERRAAEQAEAEQRRQREQREQEARRVMEEQRRAAVEATRADQEWQNSIEKGPQGVRNQLDILLAATAGDRAAQQAAIDALYTLFSQIVARPEEVNFRRIRRNHPKFEADIGRHPGGKEILIASGFRLGAIDDVPSYISTEPDLEKDMDGWSAWFDLKKETLAIIEEAMIKL